MSIVTEYEEITHILWIINDQTYLAYQNVSVCLE